MGGKRNTCVRCGKPSYGNMCRKCRYEFRDENRSPNYRGGHRVVPCPGCQGPMSKDATLCVSCLRKSRDTGREMTLRPRAPELVTVVCHTCGVQFVAVNDWDDAPSLKRGLREDKPDDFYCKEECYSSRSQSGDESQIAKKC